MLIAQKLRKENIAEYLLYMWQVEDIIRAYGCNLMQIKKEYISRFDCTDEQKEEMVDWYGNLIRMINQEGCREKGHIQINKLVLQQLSELHAQLLNSPKFPFYSTEYYKVLPFGTMLLRLQNKEITQNTANAVKEITTFIGMLNDYYFKEKEDPKFWD